MIPSVIETEERMVFRVASQTKEGKSYRVDLLAMSGYSMCDCQDWMMRRCKAISRKEPMGTRATCCRHVILARNFLMNQLLTKLSKDFEGPTEQNEKSHLYSSR